jgi:cyclic beta-1,2-glucan synthetase
MKSTHDGLFARLRRLVARSRPRGLALDASLAEPPLRSELFSADQMEQHGRYLAESHVLATGPAPDQLLPRLAANEAILQRVFEQLTEAVTAGRRVTPASDWLLDNFYLIEEQIRTAKRHLPKNYSRELPRLANGASAGFPRVWDIALETIAHGDGRVDLVGLTRFVAAYESVSPLNLGELWAIPIMLRLALIENLRRVALRIAAGRIDRDIASEWARAMITTVDQDPKSLILVVADMARSKPPMSAPFVSEFVRGLQGQSPALALALTWVEQRLAEDGLSTEQLVQSGNQIQAADQVTIGNSIGSLRFLASVDWRTFVEFMSVVDQALRGAPDDCYARMDFGTRNRYRRVVERIARRSEQSEREVAEAALQLAREAAARTDMEDGERARRAHVGYYLVGRGLGELERAVRYRRTLTEGVRSSIKRVPLWTYLGTITAVTAAISALLWSIAYADGVAGWRLALIVVIAVIATSQLAVALTNWLATLLVTPSALPRMDFSSGIPASSSALVVIPTMISSTGNIDELVEALEVRFLANRDANLRFGLLTDFPDAAAESMPEDGPLLEHATRRIDALNSFYSCDAFFLFHRPRRWNPGERAWMGFERKRGKLADLNWLLREADPANASERFSLVVGNAKLLAGTRYVITLDTDTQLPRDAARQFVGTMAHPLNRPLFDDRLGRVRAGHGILQPRVSPSLPGTNRSRYARMHSGEPGIDPYTRTVSDVYQDLFDEGSFIGKGIYDVDAFEQAINGRFPDNRILSHDLLEGCYAR